jgi:hypothetical protein
MPADWGESLGTGFRGRVEYSRCFNRPTGLEPGQRVDLVLEGLDAFGSVALNGQRLGDIDAGAAAVRIDISSLLADRNHLVVEVELPSADDSGNSPQRPAGREHLPGGLYGEVRLEIHESGDPA